MSTQQRTLKITVTVEDTKPGGSTTHVITNDNEWNVACNHINFIVYWAKMNSSSVKLLKDDKHHPNTQ